VRGDAGTQRAGYRSWGCKGWDAGTQRVPAPVPAPHPHLKSHAYALMHACTHARTSRVDGFSSVGEEGTATSCRVPERERGGGR
jgi:hypothetical protein